MIWIVYLVYVWAGATIGRICYEFDVFAPDKPPRSGGEAMEARRREIKTCWTVGILWFTIVPVALYVHIRTPRETT